MVPALKKALSFHLKSLLLSAAQESQKKPVKSNRISRGTDIGNYVKNSFYNASLGKKYCMPCCGGLLSLYCKINGRAEHVCAVWEDLCRVIRCKMLFSWLFNWLLAPVICGYLVLPRGTVLSSVKASGLFANTHAQFLDPDWFGQLYNSCVTVISPHGAMF